MHDDVSDIMAMYNRDAEREHTRLERHQLEFDLTWRYLERFLPNQGHILEIGAATGRYTMGLAQRGYRVTAVDMSPVEQALCRQNLGQAGLAEQVQTVLADGRDLSTLGEQTFEAVLLMGPLYHLVVEADRELALRQALAHLRPGGVLFSAFICRFGILGDLMKNVPDWIYDQADVQSVIAHGKDDDGHPRGGFRGYFADPAEIVPLHERVGLVTKTLAAVEPCIGGDDESYNLLEGETRRLWLDTLEAVSAQPALLGASRHLLYIGYKAGAGA